MTPLPGDILLVRDYTPGDGGFADVLGELIMAGERARYGDSDYAVWTHSALIVSPTGDLVEALAQGVERTNLSKYAKMETLIVSPPVTADKRAYACRFAEAQVGTKYDVLDFVSLAFMLLTGWKFSLHTEKRFICSGLVGRATECYTRAGYNFPTEALTPADLGAAFDALSGEPLPPLSFLARLLDKVKAISRALSPF